MTPAAARRWLLGALVVGLLLVAATAWALHARKWRDLHSPVLVQSSLVDPLTGAVVGVITSASAKKNAIPDRSGPPGTYTISGESNVHIDPRTGRTWLVLEDDATSTIDRVALVDASGRELWSTPVPFDADPEGRWAMVVRDHVIARRHSGVYTFDRATGRLIWEYPHVLGGIEVAGDAVVGTRDLAEEKEELVALELSDGSVRFTVPMLPSASSFDVVGGLIRERSIKVGRIFDRRGVLRVDSPVYISCAIGRPEGLFVLGADGLALYREFPRPVWLNARLKARLNEDLDVVALETGDFIALAWGGGSENLLPDTAITIARIERDRGETVWQVERPSRGDMKEWADHQAYVEVRGEHLVLVSQAPCGSVVEVLRAATGESVRRWTFESK